MLGSTRVAVGDTLGELIQMVYGTYTYRHHQAVLAANPWLTDPDNLRAGQSLVFPALTGDTETMPAGTWWISLSRESSLESALARFREEKAGGLPLRLLSQWQPQEGMSFHIVVKTCFENRQKAISERERMGLSDPARSQVICLEKTES
jgi:phage tail protein X